MVVEKKRKDKGQSLFEFVVFLPFLLFVLVIMFTVGNAINGSINQQKATRRYFFYINKGNSTLPRSDYLRELAGDGLERVGAVSLGWREKSAAQDTAAPAYATCYSLPTLFGKVDGDECDKPSQDEGSNFIRIYTQFGLCGETYAKSGDDTFIVDSLGRARSGSCTIQ